MGSENSFWLPGRYVAYVSKTNEKTVLHQHIKNEYEAGNLPIKYEQQGRVLDLGCGTGANTEALSKIFRNSLIVAIDRSPQQLSYAVAQNVGGVIYIPIPFEDFSYSNYDFVLASHVLQYIDTDPKSFIRKMIDALSTDGEAWIVQQTRKGMYEIISHQKAFLTNPRFNTWLTLEDYIKMVDEIGFTYRLQLLPTSIDGINFENPSEEDRRRLEFMFCLDQGFDQQPAEFKSHLSKLTSGRKIYHPNGIIKIRRR